MKYTKFGLGFVALVFIFLIGYLLYVHDSKSAVHFSGKDLNPSVIERTFENYGQEVAMVSAQFNIDPAYLLALIALESSGRKIIPRRFESRVYTRLKSVRDGQASGMEFVTRSDLKDVNDAALKNLACSWGPYQLMGYKCIQLGVNVADIRGQEAMFHGAKWIRHEYGHLLDQGRYKDAFHYHNTGRKFPENGTPVTHDQNYVPNGLNYMKVFNEKLQHNR